MSGCGERVVVFDCDGVLIDTERISVQVGRRVLAELGWHLAERDFIERFVGCSREHFDREVSAGLGRVLEPGWDTPFAGRYDAAFEAELTPVEGIADVLNHLDEAGVRYCVASNSDVGYIRRWLAHTRLADRFGDRLFSATHVSRGKPAPDVYLWAAEQMGVAPADCTVVEDSPRGVRAAVAAGMRCFAYAGGVTPPAQLSGLGAELFHSMRDLPRLLQLGPEAQAGT